MVENILKDLNLISLFLVLFVTVGIIGICADYLVNNAVKLSEKSGLPKFIIGATIVSLGTTTPEMVVSALAVMHGNYGLSVGNAIGSIICDTGLILGIATIIGKVPLDKRLVNRQGLIQISVAFLLIIFALPWSNLSKVFEKGGHLPQVIGWFFLLLLGLYILFNIVISKKNIIKNTKKDNNSSYLYLFKIFFYITILALSSEILILSVKEISYKINIPQEIIAATLVAFGTSFPELVTSVAAVRKGYGEVAIGNIIGADILNILFVIGVSASLAKDGIYVSADIFKLLFPAMIAILLIFRMGIFFSKNYLHPFFGLLLILSYIFVSLLGYII